MREPCLAAQALRTLQMLEHRPAAQAARPLSNFGLLGLFFVGATTGSIP